MKRRSTLTFAALAALAAAALPARAQADDAHVADEAPKNLDVLFVIDNSGSMGEEQAALTRAFPVFLNQLANAAGGLPSLHIGVVSSNVGVGGFNITGCGGDGDNGLLQNTPRQPGCSPPVDRFIIDLPDFNGTRIQNYSGTLADAFSCIAPLGTQGCGFEQHLESMKRALDGQNPANFAFLRNDAHLLVVVLADEDDCSAVDSRMYDPNDTSLTGTLGPLSSFRCTEFGVECAEGKITRNAANYTGCRERTDSFVRPPENYANFLGALKTDPGQVLFAAIVGNPTPVSVIFDDQGLPRLAASCSNASQGEANPGVRLASLAARFGSHGLVASICNDDYSGAMQQIGELAVRALAGDLPPTLPDAGVDGDGGLLSPDGGLVPPAPEPGCGCSVGRASPRAPAAVFLLLGLAAILAGVRVYGRRAPSPRGTRRISRPSR